MFHSASWRFFNSKIGNTRRNIADKASKMPNDAKHHASE